MTTYKDIKIILEDLEQELFFKFRKIYPDIPAFVPSGVANGYGQFFSCENVSQAAPDDQKCIVICGVGINYDQGKPHPAYPNIEPWLFTRNGRKSWVEDYSSTAMRQALDKNLVAYYKNSADWFQNGYAASSRLLETWGNGVEQYPYILLATNVSPFLTEKIWTDYPTAFTNYLLHAWNPNDHLCKLNQLLGNKIDLWVIHGKQAVWPRFDSFSYPKAFQQKWLLTHNLSRLGMKGVGSFWKNPYCSSAWPPSFPCCT